MNNSEYLRFLITDSFIVKLHLVETLCHRHLISIVVETEQDMAQILGSPFVCTVPRTAVPPKQIHDCFI